MYSFTCLKSNTSLSFPLSATVKGLQQYAGSANSCMKLFANKSSIACPTNPGYFNADLLFSAKKGGGVCVSGNKYPWRNTFKTNDDGFKHFSQKSIFCFNANLILQTSPSVYSQCLLLISVSSSVSEWTSAL